MSYPTLPPEYQAIINRAKERVDGGPVLESHLKRCKSNILASLSFLQLQTEKAIELLSREKCDPEELVHTMWLIDQNAMGVSISLHAAAQIAMCGGEA